jgi:glycosyltransferase involved in cell wall biosynthesis
MINDLGIVIPAFNESRIISEVITSSRRFGTVIVVDDGSNDDTTEVAKKAGAIVLTHPINMGVGFATITGNKYAIDTLGCNIVINIDADGQHSPDNISDLVQKIDDGYDFVFGTRMKDNKDMPIIKKIGNFIITSFNNLIFTTHLSDTQTGLRAFTRAAWEKLYLKSDDYSICSEFACEVGRNHLKYCEISIKAVYDDWTKIKGTNIFHGIRIMYNSIVIKVNR